MPSIAFNQPEERTSEKARACSSGPFARHSLLPSYCNSPGRGPFRGSGEIFQCHLWKPRDTLHGNWHSTRDILALKFLRDTSRRPPVSSFVRSRSYASSTLTNTRQILIISIKIAPAAASAPPLFKLSTRLTMGTLLLSQSLPFFFSLSLSLPTPNASRISSLPILPVATSRL